MNFRKLISLFAVVLFLGSSCVFAMEEVEVARPSGDTQDRTEAPVKDTDKSAADHESDNEDDGGQDKDHSSFLVKAHRNLVTFGHKMWGGATSVGKYFCPSHYFNEEGKVGGVLHSKLITAPLSLFCPKTPFEKGCAAWNEAWEALTLLKNKEFKKGAVHGLISFCDASIAIISTIAIVYGVDAAFMLADEFGFGLELFGYQFGTLASSTYEHCALFIATALPSLFGEVVGETMVVDAADVS